VIKMPNIHSLFLFEHKFDEFLVTLIGEEENGMALNVNVRVCASERRPVGGSSETVSAAEEHRDPGVVRDDRAAAVRRGIAPARER
jgi:hypothetical protein